MTKSVTKIQDKDTRKRLSVVRSKEDPTKYGVVILNPDGSKIKGPKGDPGPQGCPGPEGPSICDANFSGDDIVFQKTNGCCVVLEDAKCCLQGPQGCTGNGICCTTLNPDYTLTLQYTNGCCDTTGSIRGCQGEQGNPGPTGNGICCTTCSKVGKTTTVQFDYTNGTDFCFSVQDGQDGQGSGDMLACVYDPCNCAKDTFDYDNFYNTPDLTCYQEKLTAGNNITINANTISGDYNYAEPTTAAACGTKCVCIPEITQLCPGQTIIIKPTITATNCATNLKLNSFDAYPVRYNNAALTSTTDGYVWGANQLAQLVFDGSYRHVVSKSYDANTTYTMNYQVDAGKHKAGSGSYAISRYSLVLQKDDGTWETLKDTSTNYSTATTKTVNTHGFRLGEIRYYNTTTVVANGGLIATNTLNNKAASVDMRYSTNCGGTTDWAEGDYIYLVGTIGNDGLFYLDTTKWWGNTLPSAKDNKVYIRLGIALAAAGYTMSLLDDRPIYYYDNGIKVYQQADNKQDVISDLDTIRAGAACGASALQSISCGDVTTALGFTPYSNSNPCGYTTCTGTLTSSDIADLAQCCDIPTDNCQLANGCGYTTCTGTLSTCGDITTALGYTPYSAANPCGYTTCTGTVSSCADIISKLGYTPYSSANPNGYTSCTGTLVPSNIACINGCCLTNGGDVCIQGGQDYSWVTKTISGGQVELGLRTIVNTPTSDFTLVKPATLIDGEEYAIRVISGDSYCMCLGSCFKNPWEVDTCLSGHATDQYVFLSIGGELELQPLINE